MCGGASEGILEAFSMPLGSFNTLLTPPAAAGPGGIPLIARFPAPASPAIIANEAAGAARKMKNATAIFAEVLDMTKLHDLMRAFCVTELDLGPSSHRATKLKFRIFNRRRSLAEPICVPMSLHIIQQMNQEKR